MTDVPDDVMNIPDDLYAHGPDTDAAGHVPVLAEAVLQVLAPAPGQVFLDCTVGRGGHAALIVPHLAPGGTYIGLDADPTNAAFSRSRLANAPVTVHVRHANFAAAQSVLDELGIDRVDGLLADLGFASSQMSDPSRGFSFLVEGPLDMRLDPRLTRTAADLVNTLPEKQLADLIYLYGEERLSRRIARKIVEVRQRHPIHTTTELAELVRQAYGPRGRRMRIDPATRTFMALRIAVNDELAVLEQLLAGLKDLLRPGGRAAIISFHSLEDRLVKRAFLKLQQDGLAQRLTRKPIVADEAEQRANPRSRSAKLRAIQWLAPDGN